jgi:hypothetical protein
MTEEVKTKKNIDYSNSAVRLVNPDAVKRGLEILRSSQDKLIEIQAQINEFIPAALTMEEERLKKEISQETEILRGLIDAEGSYQDFDKGWYGVKQRKVSKTYNPGIFEINYPQFAPAIIIKAVDVTKLNGLIKGGLVSEDTLKRMSVIEEKESYSYIIKVT